jgi:hypothetical protein
MYKEYKLGVHCTLFLYMLDEDVLKKWFQCLFLKVSMHAFRYYVYCCCNCDEGLGDEIQFIEDVIGILEYEANPKPSEEREQERRINSYLNYWYKEL